MLHLSDRSRLDTPPLKLKTPRSLTGLEFEERLFVVYSMQMRGLINISRMADIQVYEQNGVCHTIVVYKVRITSHLSTCPQTALRI
jgi:hypothetical protein